MKKLFWLITLFIFTSNSQAATKIEEKTMALQVLKKYVGTIACNLLLDERNIFTIERDTEYGLATYYVLWAGDKGCLGGSGTTSFYISEIHRDNSNRPFLVINDNAFGKAFSSINSRFMDSIKQLDSNHFIVVASKYAKGDANCCPSLKYQYRVSKKDREWVIDKKELLK